MKLLLDTHALVWWLSKPRLLAPPVREAITDLRNEIFVSAVSAYEIANKHRLGKWPEVATIVSRFESILADQSIGNIPVTERHALMAASFVSNHRDPFDRLLAAQAIVERFRFVTRDPVFAGFGVETLW